VDGFNVFLLGTYLVYYHYWYSLWSSSIQVRSFIYLFGSKVDANFIKHPIANIIWFIFGGFAEALMFLFLGLIWCVTIIGIPFGLQCFKFAKLSIMPFGATIDKK